MTNNVIILSWSKLPIELKLKILGKIKCLKTLNNFSKVNIENWYIINDNINYIKKFWYKNKIINLKHQSYYDFINDPLISIFNLNDMMPDENSFYNFNTEIHSKCFLDKKNNHHFNGNVKIIVKYNSIVGQNEIFNNTAKIYYNITNEKIDDYIYNINEYTINNNNASIIDKIFISINKYLLIIMEDSVNIYIYGTNKNDF